VFNIVYYRTTAGRKPVREFIYELENKAQQGVFAAINTLGVYGHELRRPFADVVRGKIRELRVKQERNHYRVMFYFSGKNIILLHGLHKKTESLNNKDIEIAEKRMRDFEERLKRGE
jgi:phage-related protein